MAGTRKARVPMAEQIRLINECRQMYITVKMYPCSGGTDTVSPGL